MTRPLDPFAVAVLALILAAGSASASGPFPAPTAPAVTPLFAGYWNDFLEHWGGVFKKQNGIIMTVLGLGGVSLFIITRGKWRK